MFARAKWISNPVADIALAFAWLPFAVMARLVEHDVNAIRVLVGLVFLLSFAHQPMTLGLVYGDRVQFEARRRLYSVAPVVSAVVILVGLRISLVAVAVVAGLWNAEHTLMQRYGLTRIYGRKAGDDNGRLEKRMIVAWLVFAMVQMAAFVDLPALVARIGMGNNNARGVAVLHDLRPLARWLVVPVAFVVVTTMVHWIQAERALGVRANPAKHLYVLATFGLIVLVVIDPIAGFVGYVASHAVEYFVTVHRSLAHRATTGDDSAVALVTRTPTRRAIIGAGYLAAIAALIRLTWNPFGGALYGFAILEFGALHILYDGFIWKLRRPALARSLGVPSIAADVGAAVS